MKLFPVEIYVFISQTNNSKYKLLPLNQTQILIHFPSGICNIFSLQNITVLNAYAANFISLLAKHVFAEGCCRGGFTIQIRAAFEFFMLMIFIRSPLETSLFSTEMRKISFSLAYIAYAFIFFCNSWVSVYIFLEYSKLIPLRN